MKYLLKVITILILTLKITCSFSQVIGLQREELASSEIERLHLLNGSNTNFHSSHKNILCEDAKLLLSTYIQSQENSKTESSTLKYLQNELNDSNLLDKLQSSSNFHVRKKIYIDSSSQFYYEEAVTSDPKLKLENQNSKPFLGIFYKTPSAFIEIKRPEFYIKLNPVLDFTLGKSNSESISKTIFKNTRGIDIRAGISDKIFIYANIYENQEGLPSYLNQYISTYNVPGVGFKKPYYSNVFKNINGYDYLTAQGIIGFHIIKPITLQFGHGKNFIGDGYRSLILSDFSTNYLFLKLNTQLGKINYQNIFAELQAAGQEGVDHLIPKKYFALHHLSINFTNWLNIGLFESVVFNRSNHFEFQYLNPIIFYRTVEQLVGSPDNAMIGGDIRLNFFNSIKLYGQVVLDELKINNLVKQNGWWANKYAIQAGIQYINAFNIKNLDIQIEMNQVRPYTYAHSDTLASFTHFLQPLSHPLGANFREVLCRIRWNPFKNLIIEPKIFLIKRGLDKNGLNYGSNILSSNTTHFQDFANNLFQGEAEKINIVGLDASYMLYHNVFIDFSFMQRSLTTLDQKYNEKLVSLGFRMNIAKRKLEF